MGKCGETGRLVYDGNGESGERMGRLRWGD